MLSLFLAGAASATSPKQKFANALAIATERACNDPTSGGNFTCSHSKCVPFGTHKFAGQQVYRCYIWIHRVGTKMTAKGWYFQTPTGQLLTPDEATATGKL